MPRMPSKAHSEATEPDPGGSTMWNPASWRLRSSPGSPFSLVLKAASSALVLTAVAVSSGNAFASPARPFPSGSVHAKPCGISFSDFAFAPSTVSEGDSTTLEIEIHNCTGKRLSGSVESFGKVVCVIAEPIEQRVQVRAHRTASMSMAYVAPDCAGTASISGRLISPTGKTLASATASFQSVVAPPEPAIVPNPGSIMVNTATKIVGAESRSARSKRGSCRRILASRLPQSGSPPTPAVPLRRY